MAANKQQPDASTATLDKPSKGDAVKIDVEKVSVSAPPKVERDRYWIGLVDHCPYDRIDVANVTFQKMTDPPQFRGSEQYRDNNRGCIVQLSDREVELVKKKVVTKWLQGMREKNGRLYGGFIRSSDNVGFVPSEGDVPMAKYLFMRRLGPDENPGRSLSLPCPETMA